MRPILLEVDVARIHDVPPAVAHALWSLQRVGPRALGPGDVTSTEDSVEVWCKLDEIALLYYRRTGPTTAARISFNLQRRPSWYISFNLQRRPSWYISCSGVARRFGFGFRKTRKTWTRVKHRHRKLILHQHLLRQTHPSRRVPPTPPVHIASFQPRNSLSYRSCFVKSTRLRALQMKHHCPPFAQIAAQHGRSGTPSRLAAQCSAFRRCGTVPM